MPTGLKIRPLTTQRPRRAFTGKQREPKAFTLPELRERSRAFTLLELLFVISIIVILTVLVAPAFTSLSKSNGRKAAIGNLLGGIEQARSQAIKDGRATYVVFSAQPVGGSSPITDKTILSRYFYHSFAIFEDDAADPVNNPKVQVSAWKTFPIGVSLRSAISFAPWASASFAFNPVGAAQSFPYLKFNANGEVDSPTVASGPIPLGIFEGFVTGTSETATNSSNFTEWVNVFPHNGRAEYTP
jgi:prepilin-type N-terminal cleavage/methylation domain-containing protein